MSIKFEDGLQLTGEYSLGEMNWAETMNENLRILNGLNLGGGGGGESPEIKNTELKIIYATVPDPVTTGLGDHFINSGEKYIGVHIKSPPMGGTGIFQDKPNWIAKYLGNGEYELIEPTPWLVIIEFSGSNYSLSYFDQTYMIGDLKVGNWERLTPDIYIPSQIQADWNTTSTSSDSFIKNKPSLVKNLFEMDSSKIEFIQGRDNLIQNSFAQLTGIYRTGSKSFGVETVQGLEVLKFDTECLYLKEIYKLQRINGKNAIVKSGDGFNYQVVIEDAKIDDDEIVKIYSTRDGIVGISESTVTKVGFLNKGNKPFENYYSFSRKVVVKDVVMLWTNRHAIHVEDNEFKGFFLLDYVIQADNTYKVIVTEYPMENCHIFHVEKNWKTYFLSTDSVTKKLSLKYYDYENKTFTDYIQSSLPARLASDGSLSNYRIVSFYANADVLLSWNDKLYRLNTSNVFEEVSFASTDTTRWAGLQFRLTTRSTNGECYGVIKSTNNGFKQLFVRLVRLLTKDANNKNHYSFIPICAYQAGASANMNPESRLLNLFNSSEPAYMEDDGSAYGKYIHKTTSAFNIAKFKDHGVTALFATFKPS